MGRFVFKLPDVGEGTVEAEIISWHVAVGDTINEEQPLVDIMTDKATVEIASPVSGRIVSRHGEEGTKVAVGSELAVFEVEAGESAAADPAPARAEPVKPAALSQAGGKALAAPAVRARARALGIDLATLTGSGANGRIQHADLDAILSGRQAAVPSPPKLEIGAREDGVDDIKIVGLRRRIAERMQDAKRRIPHFTFVEAVDVTELEDLRRALNGTKGSRGPLTPLPFLIRAVTRSIVGHPGVNAHYDDEQGVVRRFTSVHVGIATQTERGLLVPVIRRAETMDVWQLAAEIARLSAAARAGKSSRAELSGSTITVSSLGELGGIAATPIINPPEVAIVGVNKIAEQPMVRDAAVVIRKVMNLSSSFDHRIVDGYAAAAFIKAVKDELEAPAQLIV